MKNLPLLSKKYEEKLMKFTVRKKLEKRKNIKTLSLRANLCCGNNQNKPINSIANSIRKILRHLSRKSPLGKQASN